MLTCVLGESVENLRRAVSDEGVHLQGGYRAGGGAQGDQVGRSGDDFQGAGRLEQHAVRSPRLWYRVAELDAPRCKEPRDDAPAPK
jgi:hypothetical protein